jgi:predicted metal-dependent phosphoesterase TrpH
MLIDIHVHTGKYSPCSSIELEAAVLKAKEMGLDGLCFTDHDNCSIREEAKFLAREMNFLIIVGMEVLTYEGDLLIFGLDEPPPQKMHAQDLIMAVNELNGMAIAAHPFRDNGRALGAQIKKLKGLAGVESFNGNTVLPANCKAQALGESLKLPSLGGSDAHALERIGYYASFFLEEFNSEAGFIRAVKAGAAYPVAYGTAGFYKI